MHVPSRSDDKLYVLGRRVLRLDDEQAGVYLHPVIRGVDPDRPRTKLNNATEQAAVGISPTVFSHAWMDNLSISLCLNSAVYRRHQVCSRLSGGLAEVDGTG